MPGIGLNPSGCCCSSSPTCEGCPSCPSDSLCRAMTMSWTNGLTGAGQVFAPNVGGGCTWDSGCAAAVRFLLDMTGATPLLTATVYGGGCPGGTPYVCGPFAPSSGQCSPPVFTWTVTSANCSTLYSYGYRSFTATQ